MYSKEMGTPPETAHDVNKKDGVNLQCCQELIKNHETGLKERGILPIGLIKLKMACASERGMRSLISSEKYQVSANNSNRLSHLPS
jgi:hypothetical protein